MSAPQDRMTTAAARDLLGLSDAATVSEVRAAHEQLSAKLQVDGLKNNPLRELAEERLESLDQALAVLTDDRDPAVHTPWAELRTGMDSERVRELLGEPVSRTTTSDAGTATGFVWTYPHPDSGVADALEVRFAVRTNRSPVLEGWLAPTRDGAVESRIPPEPDDRSPVAGSAKLKIAWPVRLCAVILAGLAVWLIGSDGFVYARQDVSSDPYHVLGARGYDTSVSDSRGVVRASWAELVSKAESHPRLQELLGARRSGRAMSKQDLRALEVYDWLRSATNYGLIAILLIGLGLVGAFCVAAFPPRSSASGRLLACGLLVLAGLLILSLVLQEAPRMIRGRHDDLGLTTLATATASLALLPWLLAIATPYARAIKTAADAQAGRS